MASKSSIALITALMLLFFSVKIFAYDPTLYVTNNTHLLITEKNETANESIEIKDADKYYYVVVIYSGKDISGYVALNRDKEEIITKAVTIRNLFETTAFIKEYLELKNAITKNPSIQWFITEYLKAKGIAQMLENKKQDLTLIDMQLKNAEANSIISSMKDKLDIMSFSLELISEEMKKATTLESSFINNPETGKQNELVNAIKNIADEIIEIESIASEYNADRTILTGIINWTTLDLETKHSLIALSALPNDFQQTVIYSWFSNASTLRDSMDTLLEKSLKDGITKSEAFLLRVKRSNAMDAIYFDDLKLKKSLGEEYSSLKKTADIILYAENKEKWVNQADLSLFEEQWKKTLYYLQKADYENAIIFAEKAKTTAIKIVSAGLKEEQQKPIIRQDLAIQIIIVLIALLVFIFIAKNWKNFFGKKREPERVEVYEY